MKIISIFQEQFAFFFLNIKLLLPCYNRWFFFFANLAFYAALTFPNYSRSTTIFDITLSKLYTSNQELITEYANKVTQQLNSISI